MSQRLILRREWGAKHPDGFRARPLPIREWWLHHSVTIAPDLVAPFTDDDAAVRTLERIGQERFGGGISYTYPVTPVGRLYQGHSLGRVGAHTRGHNTVGAAFVLVGDYSKRSPTAAQVTAIAQRMVIDHRAGRALGHRLNGGHRDADTDPTRPGVQSSTACPGNAAEAAIPSINALADALWAAGYPAAPPPITIPEEPNTMAELQVRHPSIPGVEWPADDALWSIWTYAKQAADNGRATLALARAQAMKAEPLTQAEVEEALANVLDDRLPSTPPTA